MILAFTHKPILSFGFDLNPFISSYFPLLSSKKIIWDVPSKFSRPILEAVWQGQTESISKRNFIDSAEENKTFRYKQDNLSWPSKPNLLKQNMFKCLVAWLVVWILWHSKLLSFNAESIFIQIISSISNNSV